MYIVTCKIYVGHYWHILVDHYLDFSFLSIYHNYLYTAFRDSIRRSPTHISITCLQYTLNIQSCMCVYSHYPTLFSEKAYCSPSWTYCHFHCILQMPKTAIQFSVNRRITSKSTFPAKIYLFHFPYCSISSSPTGNISCTLSSFHPSLQAVIQQLPSRPGCRMKLGNLPKKYFRHTVSKNILSKRKSKYIGSSCKEGESKNDSIKQILGVFFLLSAF